MKPKEIMKVLVIIDDLLCGGCERNLLSFTSCLKDRIDFLIVAVYPAEGLKSKFLASGITVKELDLKRNGILGSIRILRKTADDFSPDIILCIRDVTKALFPFFLKARNKRKIIFRWDDPEIKKSKLVYFLGYLQSMLVSPFHCSCSSFVSEKVKSELGLKDNFTVIPNCTLIREKKQVNPEPLNPDPLTPKIRLVSVGNLKEVKNQLDQLKIAEILKNRGVNFSLTIAGEGSMHAILEEKIKELNLQEHVFLTGYIDDIWELHQASDIFLFTSKSEGFGVAIIEAMSAGLPCVVYDLPAWKEIDPESKALQIIMQGDCSAAAEKILELASDCDKIAMIRDKGRKIIEEKFDVEKVSARWEKFFQDVIQK